MPVDHLLPQLDFFKGLSQETQKALASICVRKGLQRKEVLFREGDRGQGLYLLESGSVQLYKTGSEGKEVVIKVLKPGELFAVVVLFEQENYPVSALALQDSLVYLMPRQDFHTLLDNADLRNDFIRSLLQKQRHLADRILQLSSEDIEERLRRFLEDHYGEKPIITPALSKREVAAAIGTVPETLSRLLQKLKSEGRLVWEEKIIHVDRSFWTKRDSRHITPPCSVDGAKTKE
ncbi:MAG: Crp/Fnr family transcriptional regulator [Candidatus Omnitrophica bacterium]|nr:Crp/Fnr family transcriptional regulator [Candidatus Omnitrophota bacterium]